MVVLNASLALVLKAPSVFSSIYDLVNFIADFYLELDFREDEDFLDRFYYNVKICSFDLTCSTWESIANMLYFLLLFLLFVFCFKFDKKFKTCVHKVVPFFKKTESKKEENLI